MRAAHPVRTLVPAEAGREIIMRCVVAAAALLLAAASAVLGVLLYLSLGEAGAPSVLGMLLFLVFGGRSEEHTSELQSRGHLVCRLLLEKTIAYVSLAS